MHTIIATLVGFALIPVFIWATGAVTKSPSNSRSKGARIFLGFWLVATLVHFGIGVFWAGYTPQSELGIHAIIFGLPALAAWGFSRPSKS